jgi:hypothetical protein
MPQLGRASRAGRRQAVFAIREGMHATTTAAALSTASLRKRSDHNPATLFPNSRPNRARQWDSGHDSKQGWAMTEQEHRLAREREEIAARVASFKATQQRFEREREEYYVTTLANAWSGFTRPTFWS